MKKGKLHFLFSLTQKEIKREALESLKVVLKHAGGVEGRETRKKSVVLIISIVLTRAALIRIK